MKAYLLVILTLLVLTACKPVPPKDENQFISADSLLLQLTIFGTGESSPASHLEFASPPPSLLEVRNISAQRRTKLASQTGWLHIQTRNIQTQPDPLSPFATGLSQYEQNEWLALGENGQMHQAVRYITDEAGKTLQINLLKNGSWYNLTLGSQSQAGISPIFDPNYGFDELAARLVRQGYTLNKSLLYKECWYQGDKFTISDGHLEYEAVFNTGYQTLRWIKTWRVSPKGEVSLVDSLEILVEERVSQPPTTVQALLQQVPASP